jgi:hypothetical protein
MTIIAAAGCLVLSLLTGIIAGVGFWALILRALLMGILGGALALGLRWLLIRFLPELTGAAMERPAMPEGEMGQNVDIVVTDPESREADDGTAGAARREDVENFEEAGAEPETAAARGRAGESDFTEELEELKSSPILTSKAEGDESSYQTVKPPDVIEDVDVLPDLESFQDSFAVSAPSGEEGSESASEERSSRAPSRGGGANDPDLIAQAIRTALARDNKG